MVEYVLAILLALSLVTIISVGMRKSLVQLWKFYARDISAGCPSGGKQPSCQPAPEIR